MRTEKLLLRGGLEADGCATARRITPHNFQRVVEPVGFSYVIGVRIHDVIILAAVKQEANFGPRRVEISPSDVAFVVHDAGNGAGCAGVGVTDFLECFSIVDETLIGASRTKSKHCDLTSVIDSPSF